MTQEIACRTTSQKKRNEDENFSECDEFIRRRRRAGSDVVYRGSRKKNEPDIEWRFCVSRQVAENVEKILGQEHTPDLAVFDQNPNHILRGCKARKRLRAETARLQPDIIFTVFGPFWMKFAGRLIRIDSFTKKSEKSAH